jgi:cytochrome P450 family 142 subfamily A polypeptide 1
VTDVDIAYLDSSNWNEQIWDRFRWLQENDPIHWSEVDDLFIVTRYDDVSAISKNQALFTSEHGVRPNNPAKIGLIDEGEPRHGQIRGMINKGFTPRMVKKLEEVFRVITRDAIDAVADKGECDFVESIAVPLPLLLIAEMLGIRKEDRARFHQWSDAMIAGDGNMDKPEIMAAAGMAFVEYSTYLKDIIEDRRQSPRDDLISILVHAKDEGILGRFAQNEHVDDMTGVDHGGLAADELVMLCTILLVAGNETTRNAISGGMQLLIEHPDQRQRLIDDPSRIPVAVEEMVRMVSPVHSFARTATRDTELRGVKIGAGQRVLLVYPTANRDHRVFDNPDTFDIDRNPAHLGFGIGSHFCLGANLARMEMRVAFEELLRRLPDMSYSGVGPVLRPSALVRSCVEMRVRYTPEA